MILWRNIENYHFDSDPIFPPFLLYVRWKSGSLLYRDVSVMRIFETLRHNIPTETSVSIVHFQGPLETTVVKCSCPRITKTRLCNYIEDLYFFEVNTKYITPCVLKTSEFSRVRTR